MSRHMRKAAPWRDFETVHARSPKRRLKGCSVQFSEPEPMALAGYSGHPGWRYTRTDSDDAARADFVAEIWVRLGH